MKKLLVKQAPSFLTRALTIDENIVEVKQVKKAKKKYKKK